jgi:hypothetical protein
MTSPESSYLEKFENATHSAVYEFNFETGPEDDDHLHTVELAKGAGKKDATGTIFTPRGAMNIGFLLFLGACLLMLFAGFPILTYVFRMEEGTKGGFNIGGTNASGQIPSLPGLASLIDSDTPTEAYTKLSADGSKTLKLVFSDEFNVPGRSFVSR